MNKTLQLKGKFGKAPFPGKPTYRNLPANSELKVEKLIELKNNLVEFKKDWMREQVLPGALVSIFYNKITAKSNRAQSIILNASKSVVGARFSSEFPKYHIITHYTNLDTIDKSIANLEKTIILLNTHFSGIANNSNFNSDIIKSLKHPDFCKFKSHFANIIVDAYHTRRIGLLDEIPEIKDKHTIITIYKTDVETIELLKKIGIKINFHDVLDETTILLRKEDLELLKAKAPYLISMAIRDFSELALDNIKLNSPGILNIPAPTNEPTIGVIDTMFDSSVYFNEWVEFKNMLSEDIPLSSNDYKHGTMVSSIIVDGATFNPHLDDGCGRFKVRHFGVATSSSFSSFSIVKNIKEIILQNKDIRVWNLSLGSKLEINQNFISPIAAILDKLQCEYDIIFVIAGTNKNNLNVNYIGSPADSINSLVVNSVNSNKKSASYSRKGPVLSFFTKPDISYYGGDLDQPMTVCTPLGKGSVSGTSFAAPWIARKMSYLIDILGLTREVAKALMINAASEWQGQVDTPFLGYGVVPINIKDIVETKSDEIRFVVTGEILAYQTFNYKFPVPYTDLDKHPYLVKATLSYFPYCSKNQGVDYTNIELDLKFGRIDNSGKIKAVKNEIAEKDKKTNHLWEKEARDLYRKWDNIKHIKEVYSSHMRKTYEAKYWGMELKRMKRLDEIEIENLKFGVVVTLKAIDDINRITEFKKDCEALGWIVNEIVFKERINIYQKAEEEIILS